MPDLSSVRVHRSQTWTVTPDGQAAELVSQTEPRWTETETGVSFADWDTVAEYLHLPAAEPSAETLDVGEGHAVELAPGE